MINSFGCVKHYTNSECVEFVLKELRAEFLNNKADQEAVKFVASFRCADYGNDPKKVMKSLDE